jgi:hypothetical protein
MSKRPVFIEKVTLEQLISERLDFSTFSDRLKELGCYVVPPGAITTREMRADHSRCFVQIDSFNRVTRATFR